MLTAKENMRRTVKGGAAPDRYVNQYEAINLLVHPAMMASPFPEKGGAPIVNAWGVTNQWPEGTPGGFPIHNPDTIVIKDIEHWKDYVKVPSLKFPNELWDAAKGMFAAADNNLAYNAAFVAPGLFEQCHHLSEIKNALTYYYTNPDEMHELIKVLTEYELEMAEGICSNLHPDAVFHHDDWGTEINSFISPDMFAEFFVEPYKQIYGYYHEHGCELVIHHCDSYAANLVPYMIEMGIDVWQGAMEKNDVPALRKKFAGQITFMGGINNSSIDLVGWDQALADRLVAGVCPDKNTADFIPCITQGGPGSTVPGTYMALAKAIDNRNVELFGVSLDDIVANRPPMGTMF
ncbi:MAG: uroporphyrinogen decarboxylase, partial [Actinomycetia bacterium]|nr:uroporphyrinogen decarboxylase [Actinomycetes bacterium]